MRGEEAARGAGADGVWRLTGVGSEVYSPVRMGRRGIGAELKPSYYRQAVKNVQMAAKGWKDVQETSDMFDGDVNMG